MTENEGEPSTSPAPREDPRPILEGAAPTVRPVTSVPPIDDPGDQDVQGTRILTGFLTRAPFHDYCCRVADRTYTGKTLGPKLQKLRTEHPTLHRASLAADFVLRLIVTLMLLGVAALVLWKTLAPLPNIFGALGSGLP